MIDVSVIVPFYGVEKYIARCALSLLKQTHTNIELIFVNDCTKDNSEQLLKEIISNNSNIIPTKIINHSINRGISAARETGTAQAAGKYLLYVDSDDYVAANMVELLLQSAELNDSDMVVCDYFLLKNNHMTHIHQAHGSLSRVEFIVDMLSHNREWSPWNKLIRREILVNNHFHWPEGVNMAEDLLMVTKLLISSKQISYVEEPLYFYNRDNVNSLVNSISTRACQQSLIAIQETIAFIKLKGLYETLEPGVMQIILMLKFNMLYTKNAEFIQTLPDLYPESNANILGYKNAGFHWRVLMYLISRRQIRLYTLLSKLIDALVLIKRNYKKS